MIGLRVRLTLASLCLAALAVGCEEKTTPSPTSGHVPFVADAEKQRAEEYKNRGQGTTPGQIPVVPPKTDATAKPQGDADGHFPQPTEAPGAPR
jgi:hypothetical protein